MIGMEGRRHGGLLSLWTHQRKNITWHHNGLLANDDSDARDLPYLCPGDERIPAATIQSGVQFYDLYPAHRNGKLIIGGTCDSVVVAGCWLSGCYGTFSRRFGNGAMNLLAARVVLANGTALTVSKCHHPDLFWSLRGGGGGVAAAVVDFCRQGDSSGSETCHGTCSSSLYQLGRRIHASVVC